MSFPDGSDQPATYDPNGVCGLAEPKNALAVGILKHLDAFLTPTGPAVVSCVRLRSHRRSAAFNNIGLRDREASLRI